MSLNRFLKLSRGRAIAWLLGSPLLVALLAACNNNNGGRPGY
jgi:hypothetical protein